MPTTPAEDEDLHLVGFPELPALLHYVRQGRCAIFVGAGLSQGAGLPTWKELLVRLLPHATPFAAAPDKFARFERSVKLTAAKHPDVANPLSQKRIYRLFERTLDQARAKALFDASAGMIDLDQYTAYQTAVARVRRDTTIAGELAKLLAAQKFPEIAGYCRELIGRRNFHERVRDALKLKGPLPETFRSIVRTPFSCVVTTNFDNLLEEAYTLWDPRGVPKAPTGIELAQQGTLLFDGVFFILKAHGDLDDESSIIFTSDDYRRVIHSNPAFQSMIAGILLRHAVLFVGYSLSDIDFRQLLDNQLTIFNEQVPPRYALMAGVGEAEREILWRTARLRVFSYEAEKHEVVDRFLKALAVRSGSTTVAAGSTANETSSPPRPTRGRPTPIRVFQLAISGGGDRLIVHLQDEVPGASPRRIWSGGGQWPDLPTLKQHLRQLTSQTRLQDVSAIGAQMQAILPGELLRQLTGVPRDVPVTISLSPETETIPWEWLIVEGMPLCLRNPVVRRPTSISDKARGLRLASKKLRALVVGDTGNGSRGSWARLPGAAKEAKGIAEILRAHGSHVTSLEQNDAIYARFVAEVEQGDYDIIHFAGHAWFEQTDAFLYFWDGKVTTSELTSILSRRPPTLLFLNSHFTAFAPYGVHFDDGSASPPGVDRPLPPPLGMMGLASRAGVGAFVGCFSGALLDESAGEFATAFYKGMLEGQFFVGALHRARQAVTNVNDATGLCYAGSGYPEIVLSGRER